jgi:hypothetical protein
MGTLYSKALALGVSAIAASAVSGSSGCSGTKPTEIVPGALTQVQVPQDLAGIQVEVSLNGIDKFCNGYAVSNGQVELPSTLGVIAGQAGTTIRITIRGYDVSNSGDLLNCNHLQVGQTPSDPTLGPPPRVLRQATVTYVDQQTLFLPMPLSFSCYDVDCSGAGSDETCKANTCTDDTIPPGSLAAFDPSLIDGTQECFNLAECMATIQPALQVDASSCSYGVPPDIAGAAQSGNYNVRITYTDFTWTPDPATGVYAPIPANPIETEILNLDPLEGYSVTDASQPLNFTLGAGLCNLVQAATTPPVKAPATGTLTYHTITNIDVAAGCPSKSPLLPFCAGQQHNNVSSGQTPPLACGVAVPLDPTPSAIYVAMDHSGAMYGAFGSQGYATAMNLSFAFPVFRHTYVAFDFLTHLESECGASTTGYLSPLINFGLAPTVQPLVAQQLESTQPPDSLASPYGLYLQAAMQLNSGTYGALTSFAKKLAGDGGPSSGLNVEAVMFFVNRIPTSGGGDAGVDGGELEAGSNDYPEQADDCPSPDVQAALTAQAVAAKAQNVNTYFVVLNDKQNDGQTIVNWYDTVATNSNGAASVVDATSTQAQVVLGNFQSTLASIATCSYELPPGVDTMASLTFTAPPNTPQINPTPDPVSFPVSYNSGCTAATATTGSGWNIANGRILLCGSSCGQVQATIGAVAAAALEALGDGGATGDGGVPVVPNVPDVPVEVTMSCADAGP